MCRHGAWAHRDENPDTIVDKHSDREQEDPYAHELVGHGACDKEAVKKRAEGGRSSKRVVMSNTT